MWVAKRRGHDAAMLLKVYAKRTKKADAKAAGVIETLTQGGLGSRWGRSLRVFSGCSWRIIEIIGVSERAFSSRRTAATGKRSAIECREGPSDRHFSTLFIRASAGA